MAWIERLREIAAAEWQDISGAGVVAVAAFAVFCMYFGHTGERWVHVLDGANLAFHEAGHPIFGLLLGESITVYGGTLGQLVFPLVAAAAFWGRREACSFATAVVWLNENLWNIARYMADARARELPLVGGGEHDWTEILTRWGVLHLDTALAGWLRLAGWAGMLAVVGWLTWRWRSDQQWS
ncbi:MAG: hypothetical protein ACK5YW_00630 [Betaproteobacteria bacterium]|jgi:hypothetical protein|nr:hypothetical protein [Betaproteobacteria bacterium]